MTENTVHRAVKEALEHVSDEAIKTAVRVATEGAVKITKEDLAVLTESIRRDLSAVTQGAMNSYERAFNTFKQEEQARAKKSARAAKKTASKE